MLRGNSDGTIVIFVSDLERFQDQKKSQDEILSKIWQGLKTCQLTMKLEAGMEIWKLHGRLIFQLSTKWQSITFEVLPAYNALGECSWVWRALVGRGVLRKQSQRKGWQTAMWVL